MIDPPYFSQNVPPLVMSEVAKIKLRDISDNGRILPLGEIVESTGVLFSLASYMRLDAAVFHFYSARNPLRNTNGESRSLLSFFNSFKKGSKSIRKILSQEKCNKIKVDKLNCITTFSGLIAQDWGGDSDNLKRSFSLWENYFLSNSHREFLFKFYNNSLGINSRVAHFVANHSPDCTFCRENNGNKNTPETFIQLFFECRKTKIIADYLCTILVPELGLDTVTKTRVSFSMVLSHPLEKMTTY